MTDAPLDPLPLSPGQGSSQSTTEDTLTQLGAGLSADQSVVVAAVFQRMQGLYAQRVLPTGEPVLAHAIGVALILAQLKADAPTRIAALLFASIEGQTSQEAAQQAAAPYPQHAQLMMQAAHLAHSVQQVTLIGQRARGATDMTLQAKVHTEQVRKLLLAMASDVRVVLIRLASRLQTCRFFAASKAATPDGLGRETLDLYAPLANRLGVWQVKWELEDLAFRFDAPDTYKRIAKMLEEKRAEREAFVMQANEQLKSALAQAGVQAQVSGRPKHIYSIWNKMRNKHLEFGQLFDLRAFRVIVDSVRDCYTVLGVVHDLWTPVPREFDDYISRPKPNGYQSLHTVVLAQDNRPFEIQIRTAQMHEAAEYGLAAHWHYKESGTKGGQTLADSAYDRKIAFVRQLIGWKEDVEGHDQEASDQSSRSDPVKAASKKPTEKQSEDEGERIYCLTPQARIIELPQGATPVDFAYHVHSDLGHRCRGARVQGVMVPLNTPLKTGQTVDIITVKTGGPSRDWLNPQLGYTASQRSRSKVRAWFNAIELQERISQGQVLLEKELQRLGKTAVNLSDLAQKLGFLQLEDLYVALAKDELSLRAVDALFDPNALAVPKSEDETALEHITRRKADTAGLTKSGVLVVGVDSLLTQLAKCCRPAPPDAIAGYVTRGKGVSIHRANCSSLRNLVTRDPGRLIEVQWGAQSGTSAQQVYPVDVLVLASDRQGLLRDISEVFARERLNVIGVNTQSRKGGAQLDTARMLFTVEVTDAAKLAKALAVLAEVKGVLSAQRR